MSIKKIGVFTSGGDAPGMNAAVRAVVRTAVSMDLEVIGIKRGYAGMIDGEFEVLGPRSVANIIQHGGTILHTARSKEFLTVEGRAIAAKNLQEAGIQGLIAIGGDGTFRGVIELQSEHKMPTIGVPGTIDNDLYGSDYTIGFQTAVDTALEAIDRLRDTAAAHDRVFFVEVMGRHAGFIALETALAGGAEDVFLPEYDFPPEQAIQAIRKSMGKGKRSSIIVVAEGVPGGAIALKEQVEAATGLDVRVSILGHIQRGGSPTSGDRILASRLGSAAVETLVDGASGVMVGVIDDKLVYTPFRETIEKKKAINLELYELVKTLAL